VSREFVGLDVGGTKIAAARIADGEIVDHGLHPMEATDTDELLAELVSAIDSVRREGVAAVGIGVPSVVEFETGRARSSVNVPLANFPLREYLTDELGVPAFVDNDANVAALAEACEGGTEVEVENLVMFTVGTGVGGGLVLGGKPYRGATGAAAEVGHTLIGMRVERGAPEPGPGFPQEGSLESLAAGSALDRLAQEAVRDHPDCYLGRRRAAGDEEITGHDVVDGAKEGDEIAIALLELLGERLGIGIANAINVFDPDVVAIGGGVSSAGDLLLGPAARVARGFTLPGVGEKTEIRLSKHGTRGGVLGAALLAMHELKRSEEDADG
jgi:glucokinase